MFVVQLWINYLIQLKVLARAKIDEAEDVVKKSDYSLLKSEDTAERTEFNMLSALTDESSDFINQPIF